MYVSLDWSSELQENQTENLIKSISTAIIGINFKKHKLKSIHVFDCLRFPCHIVFQKINTLDSSVISVKFT